MTSPTCNARPPYHPPPLSSNNLLHLTLLANLLPYTDEILPRRRWRRDLRTRPAPAHARPRVCVHRCPWVYAIVVKVFLLALVVVWWG